MVKASSMADPELQRRSASILQVAAYSCRDYFHNLITIKSGAAPASLQASDSPPQPLTDAGAFSRLPLELVHLVYRQLDIASLMRMRRLNRSARQTVDALPEYRLLTTHAVSALGAILKTGVAPKTTIAALHTVLCTAECAVCGAFGGCLSIPTCSRCCFTCIRDADELSMTTPKAAESYFGLGYSDMQTMIAVLRTLPGKYSDQQTSRSRRFLVISMAQARKAANELRLEPVKIDARQSEIFHQKQLKEERVRRLMTAIVMPHLDVRTGDVQMGVSCKGCQVNLERRVRPGPSGHFESKQKRDQLYSREGFLAHFNDCMAARAMWIESKEGTVIKPWYPPT